MFAKRYAPGDRVNQELLDAVQALSFPLKTADNLDPLLQRIGQARYVLLGEASHGTSEYYTWRAAISQRLITEMKFSFIAVEGDWPDCYRVNRYVKGYGDSGENAREVLQNFQRWPTWMWANEEIVSLTEWLRQHNSHLADSAKVGFYGLDVYSLWESLYATMTYLRKVDPKALEAAWRAYRCFEPYGEDVQDYARATVFIPTSCEDEVVGLLAQLLAKASRYRQRDPESYFEAEQNAFAVKDAEKYYRAMVRGGPDSWNIRDRHMTDTLERLMRHHGPAAKAIVWEHNTHIGDARFTDMVENGMVNVGQLVRERENPDDVVLVSFGSHRGTVIAANQWEAAPKRLQVPSAKVNSWEDVLRLASPRNKLLRFSASRSRTLFEPRGHRAIGVVYDPAHEQRGNYVPTILPRRYDAFLYFDETKALHPLYVRARDEHEVPETFPLGV